MALELLAALLLGWLMLWLILQPLYRSGSIGPAFEEPEDPDETRRGVALIALKEIDFDRAVGKLSEADYDLLKGKYTQEALQAIRDEDSPAESGDPVERLVAARVAALRAEAGGAGREGPGPVTCPRCGPRPEPDALYCSACGATLTAAPLCAVCRAPLEPGGRYCGSCGAQVAA